MGPIISFQYSPPVEIIRKDSSLLMRAIGWVLPSFSLFWTTYRLPFCIARICYPKFVNDPREHKDTIAHEMVHVRQFQGALGPLKMLLLATVFPLPVLFSGRWLIEREAYLNDIRAGRHTIDAAVDVLWRAYGYPWPKSLMRSWFKKKLGGARGV